MPTEVEVPDVGIVEFPDEMSQDEIRSVLNKKFPKPVVPKNAEAIKERFLAEAPFQPTELTPTTEFTETMARAAKQGFPEARQAVGEAFATVTKPLQAAGADIVNLARLAQGKTVLKPEESLIPSELIPPKEKKGIGPSVERFVTENLTAGNVGMAPLIPQSRAVSAAFAVPAALGTLNAAEEFARATDNKERLGAATDFFLNFGFTALLAHGAAKESVKKTSVFEQRMGRKPTPEEAKQILSGQIEFSQPETPTTAIPESRETAPPQAAESPITPGEVSPPVAPAVVIATPEIAPKPIEAPTQQQLAPDSPETKALMAEAMRLISEVRPPGAFEKEMLQNIAQKNVSRVQANINQLKVFQRTGKFPDLSASEYGVLDAIKEAGGLGGPKFDDVVSQMKQGRTAKQILSEFGDSYSGLFNVLDEIYAAVTAKDKTGLNRLRKAYAKAGFGSGAKSIDLALESISDVNQTSLASRPKTPEQLIDSAWKAALEGKGKPSETTPQLEKEEAFAIAAGERSGATQKPVNELGIGDTFELSGQKVTVTKIDPDNGDVTVNSEKYGTQVLKEGDALWVEKYQAAPRDESFGGQEVELQSASKQPLPMTRGAANPAEFTPPQGSATGIKNAQVDLERQRRGLPPTMTPLRQENPVLWDRVMARIDRDPAWQDNLVDELLRDPRPVNEEELLALEHRYVDMQNNYDRATQELAQAYENQRDLVPEMQDQVAYWSDRLNAFEGMSRRVGSIWGRTGRLRQLMFNRDFTLATMLNESRAAGNGAPLTPEERAQASETLRRYQELQREFDAARANYEQRLSQAEAERNIAQQRQQALPFDQRVLEAAQGIIDAAKSRADRARARIEARRREGRQYMLGIDPEALADYAEIGAAKIMEMSLDLARFTDEMVREFGEGMRPVIQQVWDASQRIVNETTSRASRQVRDVFRTRGRNLQSIIEQTGDAIQAVVQRGELDRMFPLVQRLVRAIVEREMTIPPAKLLTEVHEIIRTALPDISRDDAWDAIAGYGRFTPLRKDDLSIAVRDKKGQLQQLAKLRDIRRRQPLRRSGIEQREPTDSERRYNQLVNEAKRRYGVQITDPETQLKSVLDARKTYRRNRIADKRYQIQQRRRIVKERSLPPSDPELEALIAEDQQLTREFDEIFGSRQLTDEQRAVREGATLDREIAEVERQIREGDIFSKTKQQKPTTAENQIKRDQLKALKSERAYLRESINPKTRLTPEEKFFNTYEARLNREIADKTERMLKGDFDPRPKKTTPELPKALKDLKLKVEKVRDDWRNALILKRLKNRTWDQKTVDTIAQWRQFFAISGVRSLLKLATAVVQGLVFLPAREVVGAGLRQLPLIKDIAAKAPREGRGWNTRIEAKAMADVWDKLGEDFGKAVRGQKTDIEVMYRNKPNLPPELQNYAGFLHNAIKTPLARNAWRRLYEHERLWTQENIKDSAGNPVDINDPLIDMQIGRAALEQGADFWKLQTPNVVTSIWRQAIARLENIKGFGSIPARAGALAARLELPVVTVPTNMVARTFEAVAGSASETGRILLLAMKHKGFKAAVDNLTNAEADIIMRNLKSGSIGIAMAALGIFGYQHFGGYFQRGKKQSKDEPKPGSIRLLSTPTADIPESMAHNPFLNAAQFWATYRRVADSKLKMSDKDTQGFWHGIFAAVAGLLEQQPHVREAVEIAKALTPRERDAVIGSHLRSMVVPQASQNVAEWMDKNYSWKPNQSVGKNVVDFIEADPTKRKPTNVVQNVELGIPGLRKNVPPTPARP